MGQISSPVQNTNPKTSVRGKQKQAVDGIDDGTRPLGIGERNDLLGKGAVDLADQSELLRALSCSSITESGASSVVKA